VLVSVMRSSPKGGHTVTKVRQLNDNSTGGTGGVQVSTGFVTLHEPSAVNMQSLPLLSAQPVDVLLLIVQLSTAVATAHISKNKKQIIWLFGRGKPQ
jgi:hypothetical protein